MKRSRQSVFDAVELLNHQDAKAVKSQRRASQRDRQRSEAAQSQTKIYGSLVETRILLQRSLQAQQQQSHDDVGSNSAAAAAVDRCSNLLAQLLNARQTLFPVQDTNEHKPDYQTLVQQNEEDALSNTLQSEYEHHQEEWKEVLDRRNKDARLHSGALTHKTQFRVVDSSFWQQVDATVQHEELRQQQQQQQSQSGSLAVFDDTKVYQHLLKDFVATSNGDAQAAAQQRLAKLNKKAISNSSSKKKAQVDRRASKGRKIRYTEIPKLGKPFLLIWWAYMLIIGHH